MAFTTSNLLAHAPELHGTDQNEEPETTAADKTEPASAEMTTETEVDESALEQENGDRPSSSVTEQTIEPVQSVAVPPQKKLIPNLETTFGVISFLAIFITPIILLSIARKK